MNKKQVVSIAIDSFIVICSAFCLYLLYHVAQPFPLRGAAAAALAMPVFVLLIYEWRCWSKPALKKKRSPGVCTLVLLGEEDRRIKVWDLTGKTGILIGKSSQEYTVDVDLSDTAFHTYIDEEHAVLNYTDTGWWLQDTSSRNGVSIVRKGNELLLGHHAPAKIEPGDVICIAKYTRIGVN